MYSQTRIQINSKRRGSLFALCSLTLRSLLQKTSKAFRSFSGKIGMKIEFFVCNHCKYTIASSDANLVETSDGHKLCFACSLAFKKSISDGVERE